MKLPNFKRIYTRAAQQAAPLALPPGQLYRLWLSRVYTFLQVWTLSGAAAFCSCSSSETSPRALPTFTPRGEKVFDQFPAQTGKRTYFLTLSIPWQDADAVMDHRPRLIQPKLFQPMHSIKSRWRWAQLLVRR